MATQKQLIVTYSPLSSVNIGGVPYLGYSYVLSEKNIRVKSEKKSSSAVHYIGLIDRSGSMYGTIEDLIDQVQRLFSQLRPQDFFSLIWFSGEGDYKTLLKGAQYNQKLHSLLDSLRSVRGTTCFSESIRESETIIEELGSIADNVVVTLFTDGCPVVTNVQREIDLCRTLVEGMRSKITSFNCIGFGNYYNREFMQSLAARSEQGRYVHISQIKDFEPVYRETAERARDLSNCSVRLAGTSDAQVLYQSGKFVSLLEGELELDHIDLEDNQITVLIPEGHVAVSNLLINGEVIHALRTAQSGKTTVMEYPQEDIMINTSEWFVESTELLYAYAAALYAQKKTKAARQIVVRNLGDKVIADAMTSAFTYSEMGETTKMLEEAIVDQAARHTATCDISYIPAPDAVCVMEVLGVLSNSPSLYVPFAHKSSQEGFTEEQYAARLLLKPYSRVREQVVDSQNIFATQPGELAVRCDDLVYAEDRPNVSLRFTIPGHATLNARAAARVSLPESYPVSRYQTHTFVKDGNLNIQNAEFLLDAGSYNHMVIRDVPMTVLNKQDGRVILHLSKMPIINEEMMEVATMNLATIAESVKNMTRDEALLKVTRERVKTLKTLMGADAELYEDFAQLTEDQVQVLLDHGIDKRSVYNGISNERAERTENSDYYMVREISLYPAGMSSLPSVASVVKKLDEGKKLTPREELILKALDTVDLTLSIYEDEATEERLKILTQLLDSVKGRIVRRRNELSQFKIAMVLNVNFETLAGLDFNEKTKTAEFDGVCLKMDRVRQFI